MGEDESGHGGATKAPPQNTITMLLNLHEFESKVLGDPENLCCVLVTSTWCRHCGIRKIPYPKPPKTHTNDEDEEEEEEEEEDDGDEMGGAEENIKTGTGGDFFRQVEQRLVRRADTTLQRRHVRVFHICACTEAETSIAAVMAADPAYSILNKTPTPQEAARLHTIAHQQLQVLLKKIEVRCTPMMRFYLAGKPVLYSMMPAPEAKAATPEQNLIQASGANPVKWSRVFENAVVVRNEVMREHDAAVLAKARAAKAEARRLAKEHERQLRGRDRDEEEGEEEEEEEDDE